jgi:hypothetical protein
LPPLAGSKADICNPKNTVNRFSSIAYVLAYITSTSLGSRHVHGSSLVRVKRGNGWFDHDRWLVFGGLKNNVKLIGDRWGIYRGLYEGFVEVYRDEKLIFFLS